MAGRAAAACLVGALFANTCCLRWVGALKVVRTAHVWEEELDAVTDIVTEDAIVEAGQVSPPIAMVGGAKPAAEAPVSTDASVTPTDGAGGAGPLWVFGVHHKVGAHIIRPLAGYLVNSLGHSACSADDCGFVEGHKRCEHFSERERARVWFACHFNTTQLQEARRVALESHRPLRVIHVVRDPLAVVVSGYLYHMRAQDYLPSVAMLNMTLAEGIAVEAQHAINWQLREMNELYQDPGSDVKVIRLEDLIRSSESFDQTVSSMYNFTVGDQADHTQLDAMIKASATQDRRRHPDVDTEHVNPEALKSEAARVLLSLPQEIFGRLHEYRNSLGYQ